MIILIALVVVAVLGSTVATISATVRDGYGQVPTRSHL